MLVLTPLNPEEAQHEDSPLLSIDCGSKGKKPVISNCETTGCVIGRGFYLQFKYPVLTVSRERLVKHLKKTAQSLGFEVVPNSPIVESVS